MNEIFLIICLSLQQHRGGKLTQNIFLGQNIFFCSFTVKEGPKWAQNESCQVLLQIKIWYVSILLHEGTVA